MKGTTARAHDHFSTQRAFLSHHVNTKRASIVFFVVNPNLFVLICNIVTVRYWKEHVVDPRQNTGSSEGG
jgi:hypothetical protein